MSHGCDELTSGAEVSLRPQMARTGTLHGLCKRGSVVNGHVLRSRSGTDDTYTPNEAAKATSKINEQGE
ncbi:hypothetical protein [Spirosoma sp. KNUC1025]|uniref:hypothetical protein n=1 Tax=Spirosoma sp. KNUC1025 TaxID=2894082 RepID=UPI00386C6954|nr:hypothetical protein LN737_20075 [Spirosoma sp. KNUC1025]